MNTSALRRSVEAGIAEPTSALFKTRTACPVCGNASPETLYSCPMADQPIKGLIDSHYAFQGVVDWTLLQGSHYTVCDCADCGLIYQKHVPGDLLLDRIYNQMIEPEKLRRLEDERLTVDDFNAIAGEMDVLFRLCGKPPSQVRFLDYGFGRGRWARVARAMGATVFATEIGDEKKASAASIGVRMIEDGDIDRMRFDIVHAEQVFEHLVDPRREFRRLAAATSGIFKVAVPRPGAVRSLIRRRGMPASSSLERAIRGARLGADDKAYGSLQPLEHLNAYAPRTLDRLAADNRMRIVGRKRRASVAVDLTSSTRFARSVARACGSVAKSMLPRNTGYFLLAPMSADRPTRG